MPIYHLPLNIANSAVMLMPAASSAKEHIWNHLSLMVQTLPFAIHHDYILLFGIKRQESKFYLFLPSFTVLLVYIHY